MRGSRCSTPRAVACARCSRAGSRAAPRRWRGTSPVRLASRCRTGCTSPGSRSRAATDPRGSPWCGERGAVPRHLTRVRSSAPDGLSPSLRCGTLRPPARRISRPGPSTFAVRRSPDRLSGFRTMIKFMLFIDGTWLYWNTSRLVEASGEPGFVLDFGKLPRVLAEEVGRRLGHDDWTVVRTHLFGSYAANIDPRDLEPVERRLNFFTMLRQQHHYEVEAFPIEFRGKRLRRTDRDPGDPFEPQEKCVDIALATSMLFNAAMANAYDVAIAVIGDH